jgi:16S rRNA (guanine527-N7)-methyltransferase
LPALTQIELASLLAPYAAVPNPVLAQLSTYLDLLLKWNAKTNLTAIRDPEEIVRRHFGESLFTARNLPPCATLLDFGSGAGFPGLPIQCLLPHVRVTLAEAQNKKASFLREAVRVLGLETEVWARRVEEMEPARCFDVVTLRAVDNPEAASRAARLRITPGGTLASLTTQQYTSEADPERRILSIPGKTATVLELTSILATV